MMTEVRNQWPMRTGDRWPLVEDYWPRRLLHIPSMISHTRSGRATYCQTECPKYSILSYTWGRWKLSGPDSAGAPRLPVLGTTWPIPAVDAVHFTVDEFRQAIGLMANHGAEWAWIDIACIDQDYALVRMDEVGRQASIFKNAARCYVWLSHLPQRRLQAAYDSLNENGLDVDDWLGNHNSRPLLVSLRAMLASVGDILDDPWFSSLWTLQEIMMRQDALIITKEGQDAEIIIEGIGSHRLYMEMLMNAFGNVMRTMRSAKARLESNTANILEISNEHAGALKLVTAIRDRVYQSGLFVANMAQDPNLQYGMAKFRKTRRREDRVYGIMQIYNLRVGQAVRPLDKPGLEELVVEFGLAINAHSPLRGQLFVHTAPTRPGLSWCITEESAVPELLSLGANARSMTAISQSAARHSNSSTSITQAVGYMCAFEPFLEANLAAAPFVFMEMFFDDIVLQQAALDSGIFRERGYGYNFHLWQEQGSELLRQLGSTNLFLWFLGDSDCTPLGGAPWRQHYAVLLRETNRGATSGSKAYERLGVCEWSMVRENVDFRSDDGGQRQWDYDNTRGRFARLGIRDLEADITAVSRHTQSITSLFSGPKNILLG